MPERPSALPRFLLILTFLALPSASTVSQEGLEGSRFEDLVEVSEVLLDVLVTDRKGNFVPGLGLEDFRVEENGRPVELTGVDLYTTRYSETGESTAEGEVPASRFFILMFHNQSRDTIQPGLMLRQQREVARQSRRWVEEDLQPSDWVAVASYDVKLKIHRDFSQDRVAILEAIDEASRGREATELPPSRRRLSDGGPSLMRHLPSGKQLRRESKTPYHGLRLLADASGYVAGRKSLLLFSFGFGQLEAGGLTSRPDPRYYPDLEASLNDHNVAVYAIDTFPVGSEHPQSNFLSRLAHDTGGEHYQSFVSFLTPLRRIEAESHSYYALSFRSEHPSGETGYQEVKVQTTRPELRVRARRGYRYGL